MPLSIRRLKSVQSHADMRSSQTRKEISLPVTLISTTNMLSYEAPDLPKAREIMAARYSSEEDTPTSTTSDAPGLTPDGSSAGSSPTIEYNHLSAYFPGPTVKRTASARQAQVVDSFAPMLPKRVSSHSKREHERLARKRSLRGTGKSSPVSPSSPTFAAAGKGPQRTSLEMMGVSSPEPEPKMSTPAKHRSPVLGSNPFSPELEQLKEVAEDFKRVGDIDEIEDEDTVYMRQRGLARFAATDYRSEIGFCYQKNPFEIGLPQDNIMGWI